MLTEKTEQCRRLEEDVKAFNEKKKIENKISLLEGRKLWSKFHEAKRNAKEAKEKRDDAQRKYDEQEAKLTPLKNELKDIQKRKGSLDTNLQTYNGNLKDTMGKAKTHSQNIEKLEDEINGVEEELEDLERKDEERKAEIRRTQTMIAELEAEFNNTEEDINIAPALNLAAEKAMKINSQISNLAAEKDSLRHEERNANMVLKDRQAELDKVNDVENQKLELLRRCSSEAYDATIWLRNNRGMFEHDVFEPFILCGNVVDPAYAKYLEQSINQRDLTAFFFQSASDMNTFLRTVRNEKNLRRVSAVEVPNRGSNEFQPQMDASMLQRYGFIAYLKQLVTAPDSVLAYMCQNYNLHRIPVFKAEKFNDKFINEFKLSKFFVG